MRLQVQVISYDKLNMLRHTNVLKSAADVKERMKKHAAILRPKFEAVLEILDEELGDLGVAHWTRPRGGYFISLFVMKGTADKVVAMCKELGVALTPAGATYPYGKDPDNSNIRIAPSFPSVSDIEQAVNVLAVCAKITAIDKILEA